MKKTILTTAEISFLVFLIIFSCESLKGKFCKDYSLMPKTGLKKSLIENITTNYRETMPRIDTKDKKGDAHSIWFDLETLKTFIYHIESTLDEQNNINLDDENLGVRIYYSRYPQVGIMHAFPDLKVLPKSYANRHTLVMIPTRRIKRQIIRGNNENFEHIDIDIDLKNPLTFNEGLGALINNTEFYNDSTEVFALPLFGRSYARQNIAYSSRITAQNHGSMIPPENSEIQGAFPIRLEAFPSR